MRRTRVTIWLVEENQSFTTLANDVPRKNVILSLWEGIIYAHEKNAMRYFKSWRYAHELFYLLVLTKFEILSQWTRKFNKPRILWWTRILKNGDAFSGEKLYIDSRPRGYFASYHLPAYDAWCERNILGRATRDPVIQCDHATCYKNNWYSWENIFYLFL